MIETCHYCGENFTVTDTKEQYRPIEKEPHKAPKCAYVCPNCSGKV